MSEKYARRIDLYGLAEQLHEASGYQLDLEAENRSLTSDLEELKAELHAPTEQREPVKEASPTVPRVITADELKSWQCVAVGHNGHWRIIETGNHIEEMDRAEILDHFAIYPGDTIVLLQDAPAEEPEPVKVGDTISTEEELESLPTLTILRGSEGDAFERGRRVWWMAGSERLSPSAELIKFRPFTVLHLPEEEDA